MGEGEQMTADDRLENVQQFLEAWHHEVEQLKKRKQKAAPFRHNLITVTGSHHREVQFHSPFLADLLDPNGTHGQGGLFLKEFLARIGKCRSVQEDDQSELTRLGEIANGIKNLGCPDDWEINREQDQIDISIRSRERSVVIFIENKIWAPEQERQLERYREKLGQWPEKTRVLVYLTLTKDRKPKTGNPHVQITYQDEIREWIDACYGGAAAHCGEDTAPRLRENLRQYCEAINHLVEAKMQDEELVSFLSRKENIEAALSIGRAAGKIGDRLQKEFWRQLPGEWEKLHRGSKLERLVRKTESSEENRFVYGYFSEDEPRLVLGAWADGNALEVGIFGQPEDNELVAQKISEFYEKEGEIKEAFPPPWKTTLSRKSESMLCDQFLIGIAKGRAASDVAERLRSLLKSYGDKFLKLHEEIQKLGIPHKPQGT